ncbi:hypothetical protein RhiirA4_448004 [Rhizophagus irregularis]|uniref:Uncharacterized protein n=1 Tax=Rhizophagus irregularis TaxID=588596 RepID=A0A2I1H693_9GLOM|nr:hypothetical protein RhiirA4_448004 [Rhizophagus irregularis]
MFHQFITPVTTKLSFTNASDPQKSAKPISTISFYSKPSTVGNVSYSSVQNVQRTSPISNSWNDNLLKAPIYFDYPTPPNPSVERTSLVTFNVNNTQDTYPSTSTFHDFSINSSVYQPKSPVYRPKSPDSVTKSYDTPIFYLSSPTSPTNPINSSKVHHQHQILNDSLEFHTTLSPISDSTINEFKRSTLSEKKRNSIEQSNSIGRIKYNKIHNDEQENKENSLEEVFKINNNNESIDVTNIDENIPAEPIQTVKLDSDVTTDVNQTFVKSTTTTNPSNESSKRGRKIRRSKRLAVKPPLNYRV